MATPAALYYPHTNITDKSLIKTSLLLWDQVEYIVPQSDWKHQRFEDKIYNEALDIIAKPHLPADDEKEQVHERVKALVKKGIPDWLRLESKRTEKDQKTYPVYPKKLGTETWDLLQSESLAEFDWKDNDYHMTPYFGLMTMSLLAEACAGATRKIITDRADAYAMVQKFETAELGGEYVLASDAKKATDTYEKLVNISFKVLNADDIPINSLVAMRQREAKSSSQDYRNFRINYLTKVEEYINNISMNAKTEADINEYQRQFEMKMKNDLADLKDELGDAKKNLLLSKEVLIGITALGTSIFNPFKAIESAAAIGIVGVGAFIKNFKDFKKSKRKHLRDHSMSWLYLANKK